MSNFFNHKLVTAMIFGQKLVLDCSFEAEMTGRECAAVAEQLQKLFGINRAHEEPFDLHFCSINRGSKVIQNLQRRIPTIFDANFPTNLHEDTYLEHFPRKSLVYLTPDSPNELRSYDPDDIYILGALSDVAKYEPYTYEKAERQKIRTAKLDLSDLELNRGGRLSSLEIHQVVAVLLDLKSKVDVKEAIRRNVKALKKYEATEIDINRPSLKHFRDSRLQCELWGAYTMLENLKKQRMKKTIFTHKKHLLDIEDK
ncbi:mitochondrial ribonuclease P protein 1 homolog [Culicoides brevitarsis]|uniref:mitochondrial ribonuclease P protein 1 homolog n=1 Tax=Culicoides brevitarsis TaxID=469753 RepID=UPI00307C0F34